MNELDTLGWYFCLTVAQQRKVKKAVLVLLRCGVEFGAAIQIVKDGNIVRSERRPAKVVNW